MQDEFVKLKETPRYRNPRFYHAGEQNNSEENVPESSEMRWKLLQHIDLKDDEFLDK